MEKATIRYLYIVGSPCIAVILIHIPLYTQKLLLLLLRIMYACLAGLPINKLPVATIASVLGAYFSHDIQTVRLSARNAAQFLVPVVEDSQKHLFLLTSADVVALLNASEKDMPASSLLKLLYMYGQIPRNGELFLQEGVFHYAYSVMFQSLREMEKRLAFLVILMLSSHQKLEKVVQDEISQENVVLQDNPQDTVKPTDDSGVTVAKRDLIHDLTELTEQSQSFMSAQSHECGKATFESFRALLKDLDKEHIVSSNSQLHEASISERVSSVLQNVTAILLEGMYVYVCLLLTVQYM